MQKVKTKSIFSIAIILIFILLAFMLYHDRAKIFKLFSDKITSYKEDILPVKDSTDLVADDTKQPPESSSTKSLINYVNSFIPPPIPTTKNDFNINGYRGYLLNVNLLIFNFLQDKSYNKELQAIEIISLPTEIKNILADLNNYNNNYLLDKIEDSEKVFPTDRYLWLEKFIKIEKKSPAKKEQEKLHVDIMKKLEFFINFFYSEKFILCHPEFISGSLLIDSETSSA
ncbi:hypothetical protein [Rickettsia endosymbiont of Halotydeus destructor]|uniref:hypothetical protein n=1 Tax=Rickettsia endosymbiont of Halotydeus destructor TaxID=2996754 RepID=UPI003BB12365